MTNEIAEVRPHSHEWYWFKPTLQKCSVPGCMADRHVRGMLEESNIRLGHLEEFLDFVVSYSMFPHNSMGELHARAVALKSLDVPNR